MIRRFYLNFISLSTILLLSTSGLMAAEPTDNQGVMQAGSGGERKGILQELGEFQPPDFTRPGLDSMMRCNRLLRYLLGVQSKHAKTKSRQVSLDEIDSLAIVLPTRLRNAMGEHPEKISEEKYIEACKSVAHGLTGVIQRGEIVGEARQIMEEAREAREQTSQQMEEQQGEQEKEK